MGQCLDVLAEKSPYNSSRQSGPQSETHSSLSRRESDLQRNLYEAQVQLAMMNSLRDAIVQGETAAQEEERARKALAKRTVSDEEVKYLVVSKYREAAHQNQKRRKEELSGVKNGEIYLYFLPR